MEQHERIARIPGDERWPRAHRLRSPRDFARVRGQGRRANGSLLTLSYARHVEAGVEPPTRVGLAVSRRVGGAVARARVKRWLREALRRQLREVAPAWDIIITARAGAAQAGYNTLEAEAQRLITRARLWRANPDRTGPDRTGPDL
ncbi:MAG: ribonuclease P protein component [Ktedonobacterales bacterium]|nr:ribonuclease P protein component [Ktedonobacterales bacterium]